MDCRSKRSFLGEIDFKYELGTLGPTVIDKVWNKLWSCKLHERIRIFLWRIGNEVLSTNAALCVRIGKRNPLCPLCNMEEETATHIFFKCQVTRIFWFGVCCGIRPDSIPIANGLDIIKFTLDHPPPPNLLEFGY